MTLNIPAGYYEASFTHQISTSLRTAVCTHGFIYTGSDFNGNAGGLRLAWESNMMPSMSDSWKFIGFRLRDAAGTVYERTLSVSGGTAHTPATPQVSFLLKKQTLLAGRKYRGRMYVPGVSEQDVDALGVVVGSKITELEAAFAGFIAAAATNEFEPVILHNGVTAPTLVSDYVWETLCATQRRRLRK